MECIAGHKSIDQEGLKTLMKGLEGYNLLGQREKLQLQGLLVSH